MLIGSMLPPEHTDITFFSSGRAAFAFLIGWIGPRKVYLPSFTCWSLVSAMERQFPCTEVEYYPVGRDLTCFYPSHVYKGELLVFIHYFGHENRNELPESEGTLLEDASHSYMSGISCTGDYIFGSFRKILRVGDGGFINTFLNPIYEESRKLDTWLRYEAKGWPDMREAENMLDRSWQIADISGQSLAILGGADWDSIRSKRQANEQFLMQNITIGQPLLTYRPNECPLVHTRSFETQEERDSLKSFLATRDIFVSVHWPIHKNVRDSGCDIEESLWLESHTFSIPVSQYYGLDDMKRIVESIQEWQDG